MVQRRWNEYLVSSNSLTLCILQQFFRVSKSCTVYISSYCMYSETNTLVPRSVTHLLMCSYYIVWYHGCCFRCQHSLWTKSWPLWMTWFMINIHLYNWPNIQRSKYTGKMFVIVTTKTRIAYIHLGECAPFSKWIWNCHLQNDKIRNIFLTRNLITNTEAD